MNDFHGNPSFFNFIMLSRKMHALFSQYILGGRRRAPPEADLTYLIPTFQPGAKTDRRALQSKFKSWAKRMYVENYKLKLIYSGKEIIPIEDSCKIVMDLHFQGHQSVNQVCNQILEKYTWTKKNFGMDREMVVDFILKNCSDKDCIKAVGNNEFARNYQRKDFMKGAKLSSEVNSHNIHTPMRLSSTPVGNPSTLIRWPIRNQLSSSSQGMGNSFLSDLKISNVRSIKPVPVHSTIGTLLKKFPEHLEIDLDKPISKPMELLEPNVNKLKAPQQSEISPRSFRKPKNINDFKALLKAAEQFTNYPAVLRNPKTKFLGSFGLVPKRICSKKTLSKVEKEKKRKKTQDKQNMIYHQNRKNLRDRNKLNKIKLKEIQKRAYLDNFKRNSSENSSKSVSKNLPHKPVSNSDEHNNVTSSADDSEIKIVKVVPKVDEPEIIDIVSSDDENNSEDSSPQSKDKEKSIKLKETKFVSSLRSCKAGDLKSTPLNAKTSSNAGSNTSVHNSQAHNIHSFFKKPYLLPPKSKGEVAILPSSQCRSKVLLSKNSTVPLNSQSSLPIKLSKSFMHGKKSILQSISTLLPPKSFSVQKSTTPIIANKIPLDTNVYLMQKQPSGIIKMVPCKRVIATDDTGTRGASKEARPILNINSGSHIDSQAKTKYRNILPAPDKAVEVNRLKILDASKISIDEEMTKLSKWIGGMKNTVARTYFQLNVQRSKQRLESQLNAAIALVKNIRRKLLEIEKLEEQVNSDISKDKKNVI